jgi:hypothetical protein
VSFVVGAGPDIAPLRDRRVPAVRISFLGLKPEGSAIDSVADGRECAEPHRSLASENLWGTANRAPRREGFIDRTAASSIRMKQMKHNETLFQVREQAA